MNIDLTEIEPIERRVDTLLRAETDDVQFVDSCMADTQARKMWRDMMTAIQYFWRHPLAEEVREEGRAEALAEVTLRILRVRDIDVPDEVRARVEACTDLDQLIRWSERAVHATSAADLFTAD